MVRKPRQRGHCRHLNHGPIHVTPKTLRIIPESESVVLKGDYNIIVASNSLAALCGLIADGCGIGFMSLLDVTGHRHADCMCFVPLKDRKLTEQLGVATSVDAARNPELNAVLDLVGRIMSEIAQEAATALS